MALSNGLPEDNWVPHIAESELLTLGAANENITDVEWIEHAKQVLMHINPLLSISDTKTAHQVNEFHKMMIEHQQSGRTPQNQWADSRRYFLSMNLYKMIARRINIMEGKKSGEELAHSELVPESDFYKKLGQGASDVQRQVLTSTKHIFKVNPDRS